MEMRERGPGDDGRQEGFVLIMIVLLVLPLLLLAGSAMNFLTSTGKQAREVVDQACAMQAVEAAIDFAVYRGNAGALPGNLSGSGTLSNGATWTYNRGQHGHGPGQTTISTGRPTSPTRSATRSSRPRTYRRATRRVIVYVRNIMIPVIEGAVSMEDPNAIVMANGTDFTMDGRDHNVDGTLSGGPSVYGVTVNDPGTTAHLLSTLSPAQQALITGTGPSPSATTTTMNFNDTFTSLRPLAHNLITGGVYASIPNFGNVAANVYRITYVTGNVTISGNVSGAGILVIEGDLTLTGTFTYTGLVIVLGNVRFSGGGSGKMIRGGLLIDGDASVGDVSGSTGRSTSSTPHGRSTGSATWRLG
jgi:hypothetical protein